MTTSWAYLVRGQLTGALRTSVGGTLLGMLAVASVPWLAISAARGRWFGGRPSSATVAWGGSGIVLVTLVDWVLRLASG